MPGFQIAGQGQGPNSTAEVRRTYRWLFKSTNHLTSKVLLVLQKASRPSLVFEEPVMHHIQERVYFAGQHTFEALDLAWYDVENDPDVSRSMWDWMEVCMSLTGGNAADVAPPNEYKATESILEMQDGRGQATELWTIYNGWPRDFNWNTLDYTSTDLQLIEIKFRYDRAVRESTGP